MILTAGFLFFVGILFSKHVFPFVQEISLDTVKLARLDASGVSVRASDEKSPFCELRIDRLGTSIKGCAHRIIHVLGTTKADSLVSIGRCQAHAGEPVIQVEHSGLAAESGEKVRIPMVRGMHDGSSDEPFNFNGRARREYDAGFPTALCCHRVQ